MQKLYLNNLYSKVAGAGIHQDTGLTQVRGSTSQPPEGEGR
jgi:hypothetical protein